MTKPSNEQTSCVPTLASAVDPWLTSLSSAGLRQTLPRPTRGSSPLAMAACPFTVTLRLAFVVFCYVGSLYLSAVITTKLIVDFDRNFDWKNTKFWPKLIILTEILTENHRSEKRWSKLFFDRSVKNFDRIFDRKFRSKYILTEILTDFDWFWPKFWPTIRSKYYFDRIFGQNSVKIGQNSGDKILKKILTE